MLKPKISVIIPIYGIEKYLDKCLLSVRNQTFKNIEIICVDDCSPDNSYKIVEKQVKQDNRIVFIRHTKNLGLGGARNTAIRIAKAEYIASVDSDDYILPTMLETLWQATNKGWFDIVCCGFNRVDSNGNIQSKFAYTEKQIINDNNSLDIFSISPPAFWNKLWRRSLFIDNDIFFPEHDYYEDMSTTPRIVAKSRYIRLIEDRLYQYLIRDKSIMSGFSDKHVIDYLKGFEIIFHFLLENKLDDYYKEAFNRYVKNNFLFYAKSILSSNVVIGKKIQYLRFLVLFRISFTENFSQFNWQDVDELILYLRKENLQGVFFEKHKILSSKLEDRQYYIERQKEEIKIKNKTLSIRADTINSLQSTLNDTKKELVKNKVNFYKTENKLKEKSNIIKARENYIERQCDEINRKTQEILIRSEIIHPLRGEVKFLKGEVKFMKRKVKLLENEAIEKISFFQILGVVVFAIITIAIMGNKKTMKLIYKPRSFFKDSKNNFAKKYASLFKII